MLSLTPGRVVAGKYRLDKELAHGGMGSLWIAFDRRLRRKIAIKFINTATKLEELRVRFEREARAAAQIRSPHVVQIHDYGVDRGHAYIVMELLEGEDLSARLARDKRLEVGTLSKMLGQIAKGLDAVHAAGVIHRDLKPANVFLSRVAGEETVKLVDFGVACAKEQDGRRMTGRGTLIGTVKYMAPEQARGDAEVDYRVDHWALAVILYRLLTGKHPFHGGTLMELIVSICRAPIVPPSKLVANLPAGIDAFFERAFMRDPSQRFHSAHQMASAFSATISSPRNVTIPWGAKQALESEPESRAESEQPQIRIETVEVEPDLELEQAPPEPNEAERKTKPETASARRAAGEIVSPDSTRQRPSSLPPLNAMLPSHFTPARRSLYGDASSNRWWWASVPAALMVVAAVVVGVTMRTRPSTAPSPPASSAQTAPQAPQTPQTPQPAR